MKDCSILLLVEVAVDQSHSFYLEQYVIVGRPANRVRDKPTVIGEIVTGEAAIYIGCKIGSARATDGSPPTASQRAELRWRLHIDQPYISFC